MPTTPRRSRSRMRSTSFRCSSSGPASFRRPIPIAASTMRVALLAAASPPARKPMSRIGALSWSILGLLATGRPSAAGEGDFFPRGQRVVMDFPGNALLIHDFDKDGLKDVAVAHEAEGKVGVLFGSGDAPGLRKTAPLEAGLSPVALAAGDLDGDGLDDLVVANSGSGTVSVFRCRARGELAPLEPLRLSRPTPRAIGLSDLDGDRRLDVITSDLHSGDIEILLGDGRGGMSTSRSLSVGEKPHSFVAGDFDRDGRIDLAVPVYVDLTGLGQVRWFRGRGDGTFESPRETLVGDAQALRFSVGLDLDSDDDLDLVVLGSRGAAFVLWNLGTWSFQVEEILMPDPRRAGWIDGASPFTFLADVDIDADGDPDLL